mmetsp:Transcript_15854/g.22671  ORF Transcript_15854/g.22671 Transcript_15854/m.22671 type:complete len:348 (-) Transcript_15854:208-1251(-)|eukprot:CAMPEP_0172425764 /NCGR_PEP_ID=MMETSP1064-20121228/33909_1 /TAXON_ID=202472 /ORGANISM="Aulacoseira subarctica , Strain CCAP 1002/5" /LENGTH=347 /DNA_ID=CAMNT_0013168923 /DNA_START=49 /DNA_END=1092 /DNA_ORIENTATION=-
MKMSLAISINRSMFPGFRLYSSTAIARTIAGGARREMIGGVSSHHTTTQSTACSKPPILCRCHSTNSSSLTKNIDPIVAVSSDGIVATPIDFDVASRIEGKECQIVTVELLPNQVLRAESGAMMYMTTGVTMETSTGGGIAAGMKRMLTGQNFFLSDYRYTGDATGLVCLGTDFPSKILRLNLEEYGGKIVCQQGALLCAAHTVDVEMEFTKKLSTGFFGGEGFILQALLGTGSVFVKAGGALIKRDLAEGEVLRISSGCLVAFTSQVAYDIQVMPGFKNVLFGGEGLFVTTLTGPGSIWLQGMPPQRMVSEIARRVPSGGGVGLAIPVPGLGGAGGGGETSGEAAP